MNKLLEVYQAAYDRYVQTLDTQEAAVATAETAE